MSSEGHDQRGRQRRMALFAARLLLLLASLALIWLLAEIAVRAALPQLAARPHRDRNLGWASREYQDFDPLAMRPGAARRILFLGDSFLAGSGVHSLDERFPILLGERLGAAAEVAVFATGGWGTDQQLLAMMAKGSVWRPDLVILAFSPVNDLVDIVPTRRARRKRASKPFFVLSRGQLALYNGAGQRQPDLTPAPVAPRGSGPRSALLDLIRYQWLVRLGQQEARSDAGLDAGFSVFPAFPRGDRRYAQIVRREPRLDWSPQQEAGLASAYIHEDFEINAYQWALFEQLLRRLDAEVRAVGGELFVLLLPAAVAATPELITGARFEQRFETPTGAFTFRAAEPRDRLRAITSRQGVGLIDPTPGFVEQASRDGVAESFYFTPDHHFDSDAHRWLAGRLMELLREAGALP